MRGTPGRSPLYWGFFALAQAVRLRYRIEVRGAHALADGPALLVGNHISAVDPVLLGVSLRRRLVFFVKSEAYRGPVAGLLSALGQLPLVRGDQDATDWALHQTPAILARGAVVCIYPEGTRSPDGHSLHRLHPRVLVPLVRANPEAALHVVSVAYQHRRFPRRVRAILVVSPALPAGTSSLPARDLTALVRDRLLEQGAMPYVHAYGTALKEKNEPSS